MHFDYTLNVGTVVAFLTSLIAGIIAWRDLTWRVKNLETWRGESIDGLKARAVIDHDFQNAVLSFRETIAGFNAKFAAMDKDEERKIFMKQKGGI